jgi:hypothetical protein
MPRVATTYRNSASIDCGKVLPRVPAIVVIYLIPAYSLSAVWGVRVPVRSLLHSCLQVLIRVCVSGYTRVI